ncbi:MAG: hypothetical protein IT204_03380 [Fimbriimonadaceae bacterium]|nr:hypothetical protein [Fimbriimonadaceae bacterium]
MGSTTIQGTTGTGTYDVSARPKGTPKQDLDADAFMQLFIAQLRYQDPMKGTDTQQMMEQMATLSTFQQQTTLNKQMGEMLARDETMRAMALIGHQVNGVYNDQAVEGKVDSVTMTDGEPVINIGALGLSLDDITKVS